MLLINKPRIQNKPSTTVMKCNLILASLLFWATKGRRSQGQTRKNKSEGCTEGRASASLCGGTPRLFLQSDAKLSPDVRSR